MKGVVGFGVFSVGAEAPRVRFRLGDGILDLAVCGYVRFDPAAKGGGPGEPFPGPLAYAGEPMRLLLGRADGTFEDATKRGGLWSTEGRGMCVSFADLTGSGPPELIVANDALSVVVNPQKLRGAPEYWSFPS